MADIIANVIYLIHVTLILSVIAVPFLNSPYFLLLHSVFVPFLIFHWLLNNNTCVLTTLEKKLSHKPAEECITCKLIDPMFMFVANRKSSSKSIYIGVILLWLISTVRLGIMLKNGKIRNIHDLFELR